eukprot:g2944.t1
MRFAARCSSYRPLREGAFVALPPVSRTGQRLPEMNFPKPSSSAPSGILSATAATAAFAAIFAARMGFAAAVPVRGARRSEKVVRAAGTWSVSSSGGITSSSSSFLGSSMAGSVSENSDEEMCVPLVALHQELQEKDEKSLVGVTSRGGGSGKTVTLEEFGNDLTKAAEEGKMDPLVGRAAELERTIQILARRQKNNPVLIGEPGVGKTAIAEGLAQKIVSGDVPELLQGKRIVQLDLAMLLAGTRYRGEFEERLKNVIKEVLDSKKQIILMIDEIHTIVGAGGTGDGGGAIDAGNIMKPALSRGELQVIGATTIEEYHRFLPDKAIDVLDETGARVRLRESSILPEEAKEAQQKLKEVMGSKDPKLLPALLMMRMMRTTLRTSLVRRFCWHRQMLLLLSPSGPEFQWKRCLQMRAQDW